MSDFLYNLSACRFSSIFAKLFVEQGHYDFIVVGAGAAGSVLANRLTECEDTNVLLIEAGGDAPFESFYPGLSATLQKSYVDWNYTSVNDGYTQQCKKNNVLEMTRGKALGGSSILNYMIYARGNPRDFELWAKYAKDDIWKWENVLPYYIKSEKITDPDIINSPYGAYHGTEGYLGLTKFHYAINNKYLKAFKEMGEKIVLDTTSINFVGYSEPLMTIYKNLRQSTAYSFLTPIKDRQNLYVLKNTLVTKILFNKSNKAIGVQAVTQHGMTRKFKACKEVILSAGAINTPQLLLLSGIGPRAHLQEKKIKVIVDSPGVGKNLQDHIPALFIHKNIKSFAKPKPRNPYKTFSFIVGYSALNKSQKYPDYQITNVALDNTQIDIVLQFCSVVYLFDDDICNTIYEAVQENREIILTFLALLNPISRGQVRLQSSNPFDYPLLFTGFYSNDADLEKHVDCVLDFMKIQETTLFKSWNAEIVDPKARMCRGFEPMSRDYLKCYLRCLMASLYHYSGTTAMGSVVDSHLRVYGVSRLRVVDASIMPTIVGGNTYAPSIMIAEKAADLIKENYNLNCNCKRCNDKLNNKT